MRCASRPAAVNTTACPTGWYHSGISLPGLFVKKLFSDLPPENRLDALLDMLFSGASHEADNAAVFQALAAASDRYDGMPKKLMKFVTDAKSWAGIHSINIQ